MAKLELFYPCKPYPLFQKFGECHPSVCDLYKKMGLKGHNGEDVAIPSDTRLYAAHDGVITYAGEDGSNGYLVVIRTDKEYEYDGSACYFKTLYAHLRKDGIAVKAGQVVTTGDFIALSDNTGLSTGPHLHFGLKPVYRGESDWQWFNMEQNNGYFGAIDPTPYWTKYHAVDAATTISSMKNLIAILSQLIATFVKK